jgi:hypothetical protein
MRGMAEENPLAPARGLVNAFLLTLVAAMLALIAYAWMPQSWVSAIRAWWGR